MLSAVIRNSLVVASFKDLKDLRKNIRARTRDYKGYMSHADSELLELNKLDLC